ncbi:MAG: hypothetical protein AcusKO_27660 [Acuticoccus sp.]
MKTPGESLILPDGEAREPREGEVLDIRPLRPRGPRSELSAAEQRANHLRARARILREQADELDAEAASLLVT